MASENVRRAFEYLLERPTGTRLRAALDALNRAFPLWALAWARSRVAADNAGKRKSYSGGRIWKKHNPNTTRCRCPACISRRAEQGFGIGAAQKTLDNS